MAIITKKYRNVVSMLFVAVFLMAMDVKDILYKITMCGPYPTFSFLLTTPETVSDYDLVDAIRKHNGTWISPANQWNAIALQFDQLFPSMLPPPRAAHLSCMGVGSTLGGVKRHEELMFVGVHRIDAFLWATSLLADIVEHTVATLVPWTTGYYGYIFNIDERLCREQLAALIQHCDVPDIIANIDNIYNAFGARTGLWDKVLCYEATPMVAPGHRVEHVLALEHGCIHTNMKTNKTFQFHVGPTTGKYFTALTHMMGLSWHFPRRRQDSAFTRCTHCTAMVTARTTVKH